ncbi:cation:proton antiporter family protein [Pseudohongiella sp.]|uniref:RCK N-terminal domain-containing protein n=1 Tax=marine sediment metagenome TaxID=412755 RepID=A0A0F9W9K6_9ZZZZ|nr:cation:proton antiporter family protein [Pseudohongiella sp.]HDZ08025.1 sodium:proton exchanger [Pseudohongiella sp.]HEA64132.1 sodium:proton exchanger [Pseudohongiella sp.]
MFEVLVLSFAFFAGLLVKQIGLPPLVGFLAAGFALNAFGPMLGLPETAGDILHYVAHLGVLMLLFTVGLKLKISQLVQPQVIGGGLIHFAITVGVFTPGIYFFMDLDWNTALLIAMALGFSSTVLAAKILEGKREIGAFHGRVAIGILIIQDIIALGVIAVWSGETPSIWALWILGLPLLRPVLHKLLDLSGHDEILVLMGMVLALVIGGYGFQMVGVSGEIGALLMGVLLANHKRATEMSNSLWSLKEIFLVGFFLEIGMQGLPDMSDLAFALVFALILPLKGLLFFFILILFRLRARNAMLAGLSLTAYSEFGLIVSAAVLPEWIVPLALTVAISFVIAAPLNRFAHPLFTRFQRFLGAFERKSKHPDEEPAEFGDAQVLILGMGRTGSAAYDYLVAGGNSVIGLESDPYRVAAQIEKGRKVLYTDAEDSNFWHGADFSGIRAVVLAMDLVDAKVFAARQLRARGFTGAVISHALYEDHVARIIAAGADQTYLTMQEAGKGLGEHVQSALSK